MSTLLVARTRLAVVIATLALVTGASVLAPAASIALPSTGGGGAAHPAQTHA